MPFRRRSSALQPVNSIKHIIDAEGTLLNDSTVVSVPICVAVPNVDTSVFKPGDVRVGAKVNGFFLSIFIIGSTGAGLGPGSINWYIAKVHSNQSGFPAPDNTGVSPLRNQIFHEEKGLAGSQDGTPMAFKGVVVIPKGMRRMREGDEFRILLNISAANTTDGNFCLKAIYKSYF